MRSSVFALGVVCLLIAADPTDSDKKELEKFKGTWRWIFLESEGVKVPEDQFKNSRLVIDGDRFTSQEADVTYRGTFKVSPGSKPKAIDVVFTEGPEKGKSFKGIYELEGDVYKVCLGMPGRERPTQFVSKPGSGHVLEILRRQKR